MSAGTVTVEVRLPREVAASLDRIAKMAGLSRQTVLRVILAVEALKQAPPNPAP